MPPGTFVIRLDDALVNGATRAINLGKKGPEVLISATFDIPVSLGRVGP